MGGQAAWHARRGWVFVACDHLCVGDTSMPTQIDDISFEVMAAVNAAVVESVTSLLASGELDPDFPPIDGLVRIGLGQSMGGCLLIVQQGQHATFDAIGVLGYSAIHTVLASPPGIAPIQMPYLPRSTRLSLEATGARAQVVTGAELPASAPTAADLPFSTWGFHMDDEPQDVVLDPKAEPKAYHRSGDVTVLVWPNMAHMHNFASTRVGLRA